MPPGILRGGWILAFDSPGPDSSPISHVDRRQVLYGPWTSGPQCVPDKTPGNSPRPVELVRDPVMPLLKLIYGHMLRLKDNSMEIVV